MMCDYPTLRYSLSYNTNSLLKIYNEIELYELTTKNILLKTMKLNYTNSILTIWITMKLNDNPITLGSQSLLAVEGSTRIREIIDSDSFHQVSENNSAFKATFTKFVTKAERLKVLAKKTDRQRQSGTSCGCTLPDSMHKIFQLFEGVFNSELKPNIIRGTTTHSIIFILHTINCKLHTTYYILLTTF